MSTVDIPGVGPVDKRVAIGIAGGTVCLIGYIYWRRGNSSGGAGGGEEEVPAEFDEGGLLDTGEYGGGKAWNYAPISDATSSGYTGAEGVPRTNAEWTQMAVGYLEQVGRDPGLAADAIGSYLAGEKLTPAQATMIRTALGGVGAPPTGVHSIVIDTAAPSTPTTPGGTTTSKPGRPVPGARSVSRASITVGWAPVPGATKYEIKKHTGQVVSQTATYITISGLKRNVRYRFFVTAVNAAGKSAPAELLARTAA